MRFLYFDDWRLGVLHETGVVDVTDALSGVPRLNPESPSTKSLNRWNRL